jgi:signal transduction histidine kinase
MNTKIYSVLLALTTIFTTYISYGQTEEIDSLAHRITMTSGREQVDAINALTFHQILVGIKLSKKAIEQAITLAEKENYSNGLAAAYTYKGFYEHANGNKAAALHLLLKGATLGHEIEQFGTEGYALLLTGNIYRDIGSYDSAKYWYDKSSLMLQDSANSRELSILYSALSRNYNLSSRPQLELSYLLRALRIQEQSKDKALLIDVCLQLSKWYINKSNISTAEAYLAKAEAIHISEHFLEIWKNIKYQKAVILLKKSDFKEALLLIAEVKKFYLANGTDRQYTKLLLDLAATLEEIDYYDMSLKNGLEALKISQENNYVREKVSAQLIISRNYYRILQASLAHEFTDQALLEAQKNNLKKEEGAAYNLKGLLLQAENKQKEALFNFEKALSIRTPLGNKEDISSTLSNIGEIYESFGQLQKALQLQKESLSLAEEILDYYGICWSSKGVGSLYIKLKDFENAKYYLDKAERTAKSIKAGNILIYIYRTQTTLLIEQGLLNEAIEYTFLYDKLKDSINSTEITNRILSLRSIYELEMKSQEIELLNKEKQVKEDQLVIQNNLIQKQWLFIVATVSGLLLLSISTVLLFKYFRKKTLLTKELQERNQEIQKQAEELSKSNASLQLLNQMLSEKQKQIQLQSEELIDSNQIVSNQNERLKVIHNEVMAQNEELTQSQEKIVVQRDKLAEQNTQLEEVKIIIEKQHKDIKLRNENLEEEVDKRTKELVEYNQQLEQFAFISSHNLRAPVARILGLGHLLELENKSLEDKKFIHRNLILTTRELDRVVKDLNTILEIKNNNASIISSIELEEELKLILIGLENEIDETKAIITTNFNHAKIIHTIRPYFDSILINLISNSIKYRHHNRAPIIDISTELVGDFIRLTVKDNGLGIDLALFREKLFTLYSRFHSHVEGKGLGLYLVKTQIVAMGGTIEVQSEVNDGTTFNVYFKA